MTADIHPLWYLLLALFLSLIPLIVGLTTSYVKVSVIMSLLRSGLGTAQAPGALVVMAISIALSGYIMEPVVTQVTLNVGKAGLIQKMQEGREVPLKELQYAIEPWRNFLLKHSGKREVALLLKIRERSTAKGLNKESVNPPEKAPIKKREISGTTENKAKVAGGKVSKEKISLGVLLPAFLITELKEAFTMAFVVLLPFLVIDIVVANILVGLGMYMVSPVLIALPLKLAVFVLADGWLLLCKGIVLSYLN